MDDLATSTTAVVTLALLLLQLAAEFFLAPLLLRLFSFNLKLNKLLFCNVSY